MPFDVPGEQRDALKDEEEEEGAVAVKTEEEGEEEGEGPPPHPAAVKREEGREEEACPPTFSSSSSSDHPLPTTPHKALPPASLVLGRRGRRALELNGSSHQQGEDGVAVVKKRRGRPPKRMGGEEGV